MDSWGVELVMHACMQLQRPGAGARGGRDLYLYIQYIRM